MRPRHAYIHVPFCARRCSYCDFAIAVRRTVPVDDFLAGLAGELGTRYPSHASPWVLDTLYFGGGTPSRLGASGVARMMELVGRHAELAPGAEVTLEANPDDVTADAARAWVESGVNRISLGVQSFDPRVLDWMHRSHTADRIEPAVAAIREAGIADFSVDLIFALPEALERDWKRDLDRALALEPAHVSLYGLTIEPHTPLGRWHARGTAREAPEDRYAAEFLSAHRVMSAAGFDHYEVSNFGRPGRWSRHNQSYWRGVPYAGLGPGAHEFDGAMRRWNDSAYVEWQARSARREDPVAGSETLTEANRLAEQVYLGLRTVAGLPIDAAERELALPWMEAGWAAVSAEGRLVLTAEGWLRMDALAQSLTRFRSR
ncbi:MAG TPA: radical SAM family heme chaperone HemW [Gemmatimonadaceae bacterium]|nr:radical SAM family heme chaperone HemW [Gemmatimonadaceae bacterium]